MIERDEDGKYLGLKCDSCPTMAPDAKTILAGHGLTNMGWHCSGGTHICPACTHPAVTSRQSVPLARTVTS